MAFSAAAYLAKFDVDAYLARHESRTTPRAAPEVSERSAPRTGRGRGPRRCGRCGNFGHNVLTCEGEEIDRLLLIAERAQDLDQARRLGMNQPARPVNGPAALLNAKPPAVNDLAFPPDEPMDEEDRAFWDAEIAKLPVETSVAPAPPPPPESEPIDARSPVRAQLSGQPVAVVLGLQPTQRLQRRNDGGVRSRIIPAKRRLRRDERVAIDATATAVIGTQPGDETIDIARPKVREDCKGSPRPCPYAACAHHLYLEVVPESGALTLNFPALEIWEMAETCSLDVADRGGITLEEVGVMMNRTRERIRQVEQAALARMKRNGGDELFLPPDHP